MLCDITISLLEGVTRDRFSLLLLAWAVHCLPVQSNLSSPITVTPFHPLRPTSPLVPHGREGCFCPPPQGRERFVLSLTHASPASRLTSLCRLENNLFLVKRLIKRTDMRNPDPYHKRYTSLAWAAILGHEETFEFLLTSGHDDHDYSHEYSKVRPFDSVIMAYSNLCRPCDDRTQKTTPFSFCSPKHALPLHIPSQLALRNKISSGRPSEWHACTSTVTPTSWTGRTWKGRLHYMWRR